MKIQLLADGLGDGDDPLAPDRQRSEVRTTTVSGQCHATMVHAGVLSSCPTFVEAALWRQTVLSMRLR